ncbi:heparan sulfate 2-O-sulfotransferase pipe-like isoform X5 [Drosophila navojoa]|uniref:heparan sulfate 2-O-sulfotransferase pipe-like isoform X5 n=1 Tax=Drosophila navojoa TaxID=7232 RepID=UPI000847296B|nr:heparan sulfate 2-O-sulfotransferase pipe-like isoform X5 [Drosophila navojoa]
MSLSTDRSYKMKLRDVENAFKYRRIPYPKRSVELIALLAISCTFFLFMHTNKLNSRLKEMEVKLQPSEFSALGLTGNHISGHDAGKHDDINTLHGTYQYLKSTGQLQDLTPSHLNNTPKAEMDRIFFPRCAKVGSESLVEFMDDLQDVNNFEVDHVGMMKNGPRILTPKQQSKRARYIFNQAPGTVYIEHTAWIDFHQYNLPKPIFINLVRDPVERMISWYYYVRNSYLNAIFYHKHPTATIKPVAWYKKNFNDCVRNGDAECQYVPGTVKDYVGNYKRQSLFFCGHDRDCLPFDSPLAIQIAKRRVEEEYAVVGTWEETNITLTVLEHYIPRYFARATKLYPLYQKSLQNRNRNNRKPKVDADVKAMIRRNFTHEYDFYYFCKQRLFKQYIALKRAELERLNFD